MHLLFVGYTTTTTTTALTVPLCCLLLSKWPAGWGKGAKKKKKKHTTVTCLSKSDVLSCPVFSSLGLTGDLYPYLPRHRLNVALLAHFNY